MNIIEIIKNEFLKSEVLKLASQGKFDDAIGCASKIKSMRTEPFMNAVPDEGMFAYELRLLGFRLFAKKKFEASLQFYLKADELIDSIKTVDRIIDKQFETAKNYSDIANCKMALKDLDGARIALSKSISLLEQMPEPPYLWKGINHQYQMITSTWKREAPCFQDDILLDRINKRFVQVEKAIIESLGEARIVDYWYKWPQVPPISLY
ncbi:MAG: hypothetical protein SFY67_14225 [Candidatus Melainabacteria bacterium]|nr:hypothetical protein [Candidatus Melainabacteria bacterium]